MKPPPMREPMVTAEPPPQGDADASCGPRAGVAVTLDGVASSLGRESARRDMACGFGGRAMDPAHKLLCHASSCLRAMHAMLQKHGLLHKGLSHEQAARMMILSPETTQQACQEPGYKAFDSVCRQSTYSALYKFMCGLKGAPLRGS